MHLSCSLGHLLHQTCLVTFHLYLDILSCCSIHVIQITTVIFWKMLTISIYLSFCYLLLYLRSLTVIISFLFPLFHVLVLRMLVPDLMKNQELYRPHVWSFHCLLCSHRLFLTLKLFHYLEKIYVSHLCHMGRLLTTQIQGFPCFCHHHTNLILLKKKFWVLKLKRLINHQVFLFDVWELLLAVL